MTEKEYLHLIEEFGLKLAVFRYKKDFTAYLLDKYPVCNYREQGCISFYRDNSMLFYQPSFKRCPYYNIVGASEDYFEAKRKLADHLKEIKKQLVQLKVQEIKKDFE